MKKMTIFRRNSFRGVSVREKERGIFWGEREREGEEKSIHALFIRGV